MGWWRPGGAVTVSANGRTAGATFDSGGLETVFDVTSGAFSESVTLLGAYATSNFALSTDSHGGTLLTWVASGGFAVGMPGVQRMASAMAAFTPSGGTSLNTAATSASHAPLLAAGH